MKKLILFVLLLPTISLSQLIPLNRLPGQKGDWLDINYTLAFKETMGLKWTGKMGEKTGGMFDLQGFNGQFFYNQNVGSSKLGITYDTYRGMSLTDRVASKWGLSFSNTGPNTNISINLHKYEDFGVMRFDGVGGTIDIVTKF